MRIVSFNVNGIRARPHQLEALRDQYDPDVIGLQEIKVHDPEFPIDMIKDLGYEMQYHGQKGHYGVGILSKLPALETTKAFPDDETEAQRRIITSSFDTPKGNKLTVINGYFPQGESNEHETKYPHKRKFYRQLDDYLTSQFTPEDNLMVIGDVNIAYEDKDIGIGADNAKRWLRDGKCSFLPEEREWMDKLMAWGLFDTYRTMNPDIDDRYSWFDYRSKGFNKEPKRGMRIDMLMATAVLNNKVTDTGIAYDIRGMERPSDHCPIWVDIDI